MLPTPVLMQTLHLRARKMHSGFNLRIEQFFSKADLIFYMHTGSALGFLIANVRFG